MQPEAPAAQAGTACREGSTRTDREPGQPFGPRRSCHFSAVQFWRFDLRPLSLSFLNHQSIINCLGGSKIKYYHIHSSRIYIKAGVWWLLTNTCYWLGYLVTLFYFICFLGPHLQNMEVPRLGTESEQPLPAYATAYATQDPSHVCKVHHSSRQRWIPDPPSEARDRNPHPHGY